MRKWNDKAWTILTAEEKTAVTLQLVHAKSTWEAGEIMKKAHYKYLEIFSRGKQFLSIFTRHFEFYNNQLFPEDSLCRREFMEYMNTAILDRKSISSSAEAIKNKYIGNRGQRESMIIEEMARLAKSKRINELNLYNLIIEFDRWNNFRILPRKIQEPSAFKRRNKNRHKKHIKDFIRLNPMVVDRLKFLYEYNTKVKIAKRYYVPLIESVDQEEFKIMPIRASELVVTKLSSLGLYVFHKKELAQEFGDAILEFYCNTHKSCTDGLRFWPKYRELIFKSVNYDEVNNIVEFRKFSDLISEEDDEQQP